jgi:hypothetical protein
MPDFPSVVACKKGGDISDRKILVKSELLRADLVECIDEFEREYSFSADDIISTLGRQFENRPGLDDVVF